MTPPTIVRFVAWSGIGLMIYGARRSKLAGGSGAPREVVLEEPGGPAIARAGANPAPRRD